MFARAALLLVAAAMLAGFVLRLHGYTRHDLWLDEANSVAISRHAFTEIPAVLAHDSSPPLYYFLLRLWMGVMGESEAAVRFPSVLLGTALVAATALLAHRLAGGPAAVVAAWLMAVTPMAVQFSQQTRMYTLLPLFAVAAVERLLVYLRNGSRGALALHTLALVACFYTHNWGLLLVPGCAAAVLLGPRARWRRWAAASAGAIVAYAPWIPSLWQQMHESSYRFIEVIGADSAEPWLLPLRSIELFATGVGNPGEQPGPLIPDAAAWLVTSAWILVAAAAIVRKPDFRVPALQVLAPILSPLCTAAAWSLLGRPIYFLGRYEIMVLPMMIAVVAAALALLVPPRPAAAIVGAWGIVLATLSWNYTSAVRRTYPEPTMARALAPALRAGDRVVFTGLFRATTEYYLRRAGAIAYEAASFPPDVAGHLGWHWDDLYDVNDPALQAAAQRLCPTPGHRAWVVGSNDPTTFLLLRVLGSCASLTKPFAAKGRPASSLFLAEKGLDR